MSEWIAYTGTDEQIKFLLTTGDEFITDGNKNPVFRHGPEFQNACDTVIDIAKKLMAESKVTKFLICNPHPLADMIKRWADTGQPVYWQEKSNHENFGKCLDEEMPTHWDGWDIRMYPFINCEEFNYSFNPFSGE